VNKTILIMVSVVLGGPVLLLFSRLYGLLIESLFYTERSIANFLGFVMVSITALYVLYYICEMIQNNKKKVDK
jgi:TM2 domain-containing membrane protein YozV